MRPGNEALTRLWTATGGAKGSFQKLIEAFQHTAAQSIVELEAASEAGDLERVIQVAHRMRGSSPLYGAIELAALVGDLETAARRGEPIADRMGSLPWALDLAISRIATFTQRLSQDP